MRDLSKNPNSKEKKEESPFKSKLNSSFRIILFRRELLPIRKWKGQSNKKKKIKRKLWKETQITDLRRQSSFPCLAGNVKKEEKITKLMKISTLKLVKT